MLNQKKIVTHDGRFHADDVFAVAILKLLYPRAKVIRSREQKDVDKADFRVDVGRKYDPEQNFYDHHQAEFEEKRSNGIYYASSGLVWKHFGMRLVNSKEAFEFVDKRLLQAVDARDSGMDVFESEIDIFLLDDVVDLYLPHWKDKNQDFDRGFAEALKFAKFVLSKQIKKANSRNEARQIVDNFVSSKNQEYIILDKKLPWKERVVEKHDKIKFCIHPGPQCNWICEAAPKHTTSFEKKSYFPEQWRGLEKESLRKVSGVEDAVFCHRAGFIASANSKEGAIKLVEKALQEND